MAYFSELPFIEYPLRFENQSSNQDYTFVRNIFRRAKIQERIANYATAFTYYQIKENERPDQIAEKVYEDSDLDWVILITNNITNYPSQWPLSNNTIYDYSIDKYGSEEKLNEIKYFETEEIREEYNRLVIPSKLKIDSDFYQEFTTVSNKVNPLFYDLKYYPLPSKYYDLTITTNLGQYYQIWERNNLEENQDYTGEIYNVSQVFLRKSENPEVYKTGTTIFPEYTRLDFSYLNIYGRNDEIKNIFNPITLQGWPSTWGGVAWIYHRDETRTDVNLKSSINEPTIITDESRLYDVSSIQKIDTFEYTQGTALFNESNSTYTVSNLSSSHLGTNSSFTVTRNFDGVIISVKLLDGGYRYIESEVITIAGSKIGGVDGVDDVKITVKSLASVPEFRFISIGDTQNIPFPGVKITISNRTGMSYVNTSNEIKTVFNNKNGITNYDYENEVNDSVNKILILKPEYLGAFIEEFRNIMRYDTSSETISNRVKRIFNTKVPN